MTTSDALALVLEGIERCGPNDTGTLAFDVEDAECNVTSIAQSSSGTSGIFIGLLYYSITRL